MKTFLVSLTIAVMILLGAAGVGNGIEENSQNEEQAVVNAELPVKEKGVQQVPQGKIEDALTNKMQKMGKSEKARVAIWVKADGIQPVKRPVPGTEVSQEQLEKDFKSQLGPMEDTISAKHKPVKDYLESKKVKILYESSLSPLIFAELSPAEIKELESMSDVEGLYLGRDYEPMINTSVPTVLAPPVWSSVQNGTKVAVIENDGIAFANPYLKDGIYYNSTSPNIGSHATACAGIIASTNTTYRGVAYKGPALLSANSQTFADSNLVAATDWAVVNGARVLSNSWGNYSGGAINAITRYYDWVVYNYGVTVVFASGNCGDCSYPWNIVAEPAIAYSVIAVGSFHDRNTGWMWWDDYMSSFSSYKNPPSPNGDREKPEVAAVGGERTYIDPTGSIMSTTTATPWIGSVGWGTSYAAPEVAGEASLLINKTTWLGGWPETVKAVIMASADHNIEGSSRLSDQDGAGGINVNEAYNIVTKPTRLAGISLTYSGGAPWYGQNITVSQGQKVRVAIAWDSNSTGYGGSDILNADLDLRIQRWTGSSWVTETRAGYSTSYDNSFEIVEFNAPVKGTYRAKVSKFRWDDHARTEYLGYAAYVK
ncbi:MAG: S8 family serine peptidase [Nitrospirota bacterium]|nr:S8 family serine peptidase [Nitrospirota bacterium]